MLDCAKIVCITKSSKGAKIYCETGENYFIPSYIVKDLDPTNDFSYYNDVKIVDTENNDHINIYLLPENKPIEQ